MQPGLNNVVMHNALCPCIWRPILLSSEYRVRKMLLGIFECSFYTAFWWSLCPYRLHQLSMENRVQLVSVEVSDIGEKHFLVTVYAPARGVFYTPAPSDDSGVMKRFCVFGGCTFGSDGTVVPDRSRVPSIGLVVADGPLGERQKIRCFSSLRSSLGIPEVPITAS